jgi:hypothetical protein
LESNLAVLIDFENIAAGTEKEGLGRFDVDSLMKRIKDKGRILVARSYADWGRFARFKQTLLSANVTMMELTSHGMQDKNRADIAMVVDCLELAFTKDYIDTFVVVSGDSDFTPLVLKMRELNKRVIGIGTRSSTSRLLIQACDEFLFYDTIVRESRTAARPAAAGPKPAQTAANRDEEIFELLVDALEGLQRENPVSALASVVKTAMLRKSPDFNEVDLGFGSFARFLEIAQERGYVRLSRDPKAGGYRVDVPDGGATAATEDGEETAPRRGERREKAEGWHDPYLPEGALPFVDALTVEGLNPLAYATRMSILQHLEAIVDERAKKRRRVTVQFVQDDVRKRLKKSNPDVPGRAVRSVFDAMLRGGLLLHKDGRPIRSASAPFSLGKTADGLNRTLANVYLEVLRDKGHDLGDSALLAELFLGDRDRKREIEEALAWLAAPPVEEVEEAADEVLLDLDDVLLAEEPLPGDSDSALPPEPEAAFEPTEAALEEAPAEPDVLVAEPVEDEEARPKRRRRTRRKPKAESDAEATTLDDLDAVLATEDGD